MIGQPVTAAQFALAMAELKLPSPPEALAVAVSGGADSLALTLLAIEWGRARDIPIQAFTVDHGLRPESGAEAAQIHSLLAAKGIDHTVLHWQPPALPEGNIQATARDARYHLLLKACKSHGIRHLLLAQHQDDQAETFLMRLQRGSGVDGLSAMQPVKRREGIFLLRPLLNLPKSALVATLQAKGHSWVEDPSNHKERFTRTRMRRILPLLQDVGISSQVLADTATRMGRARDFLSQETARARAHCLTLHPEGYITLHLPALHALHEEIGLRVLADVFRLMNHDAYRPRFSELENLYYGLPEARTLAGCQFVPRAGHMQIIREWAHIAPSLSLKAQQTAIWDGRFEITALQPLEIRALGKQIPDTLATGRLPKNIAWTLPAAWHLEKPVRLLHIQQNAETICRIRPFPLAI